MSNPQFGAQRDDSKTSPGFQHAPVMLDEIVTLAKGLPEGFFLDATIGGGGHSKALLASNERLQVLGLDQDPLALQASAENLADFEDRVLLEHCRFDQLLDVMSRVKVPSLAGFLFDLGVSSPQLDIAGRGFSFRHDGPLDMRMDPKASLDAAAVVNNYSQGDLARVLQRYGDERHSKRIAAAVVLSRPISSTTELAQIIVDAIPAAARRVGGHPAKRSFQALRIEVNDELDILEPALQAALAALVPGGRGFVLTYHSGEDRIVKSVFRKLTTSVDPPDLPIPIHEPSFQLLRPQGRKASAEEIESNRRARSARLRSIERVAA